MPFTLPKETYSGKINEVKIGSIDIGGENTLPFLSFEGTVAKKPIVALEVQDVVPQDWPEALTKIYGKVMKDPVVWAKFCETELKADAICLRLAGTHPDKENRSVKEAADVVAKVSSSISVPLILLGCNHAEKDTELINPCASACAKPSIIGKAQEKNFKTFAAAAQAFNHYLIALSDLDINLAKQLNILLSQSGFPKEKIIMDTMSSALGYGLEYTYSVIERCKLAALHQNDNMMQMPIVNDIGPEAWKAKEAKADIAEWGDTEKRGILWEAVTGITFLTAGGNFLIMRHPEAMKLVKQTVNQMI
ncbi:MAG: acetyl-CoA decarbonylase/synthase complex subunit delta [bacterium]|nr:acetyl-CoA decarbonylase/synthase complex subunit delta [bacterium]